MTSRLLITAVLALGIMMSGAGATLAVQGLDGADSAAQLQYPDDDNVGGKSGGGGNVEVLGEQSDEGGAQADEQAAAGSESGSLAFTGFAALPLLVLGLGLLSAGVVMRRRTRPGDDA